MNSKKKIMKLREWKCCHVAKRYIAHALNRGEQRKLSKKYFLKSKDDDIMMTK